MSAGKMVMHRIVHLDLKGAPLKLPFLEQVLNCIKKWGGTGIMLEWEDSFPYSGELADIGSIGGCSGDGMYTIEEVMHILQCAKDIDLEVIQLVQTIGHLEFVLKHPMFKELQEKPKSPAVLCPSQARSQCLVRAMVQQTLDAQPDAKYFHIGADEVWHSGVCAQCQQRAASSKHGRLCLYLEHIRDLALFIKQQRPELTILLWDDMLRSIDFEILECYNLGELVQPVIWDYNVKQYFRISQQLWDTYKLIFPSVWAGSAFKGANGSCKVNPVVDRYVSNQQAWIHEVNRNNYKVKFAGVILTGWSRYDHFATLCELLPTSMECLMHCLNTWTGKTNNNEESIQSKEELPGQQVVYNTKCYEVFRERSDEFLRSDVLATWMNPWQIAHGYANPGQLEVIVNESQLLLREFTVLRDNFAHILPSVTGDRSVKEWLGTFIAPSLTKLTEVHDTAVKFINMDASVKPS